MFSILGSEENGLIRCFLCRGGCFENYTLMGEIMERNSQQNNPKLPFLYRLLYFFFRVCGIIKSLFNFTEASVTVEMFLVYKA